MIAWMRRLAGLLVLVVGCFTPDQTFETVATSAAAAATTTRPLRCHLKTALQIGAHPKRHEPQGSRATLTATAEPTLPTTSSSTEPGREFARPPADPLRSPFRAWPNLLK
jgi:hypothetical protein